MLLTRIYSLLWILAAVSGAVLYLTDSFNFANFMIWGFYVHALAGAALLVVFPAVMKERVAAGLD